MYSDEVEQKKSLRKQIVSERKKKSRVFLVLFIVIFGLLLGKLFFDDMGLVKYFYLKREEKLLVENMSKMDRNVAQLKDEIKRISVDPFYIEKQAREDLGLTKQDEQIFIIEKEKSKKSDDRKKQ
ncbi:MAG: septum formation initiator family protein [Nitrospirae bacterium]|nr:septum formation initiator family protein [Nitrospirota bacterium]